MNELHTKINDAAFDFFPVLNTKRLILRAYSLNDTADMFQIRKDMHMLVHEADRPQQSMEDVKILIEDVIQKFASKESLNWAITLQETGELIGYIGFWRMFKTHCRAELGYAMKQEHWGNGYMAEAFPKVLEFAFNTLHLHSIEANVTPKNVRSIALLEGFGFRKEGYRREDYLFNGVFEDTVSFGLLPDDLLPLEIHSNSK